jgi:hypothetical protein
MYLDGLLLDLTGLTDDEAKELARAKYRELYLNRGRIGLYTAHDGESVIFYENQFEHAFFSNQDRGRFATFEKNVFARERVERIRWIGPLIGGEIPGSACWLVPREGVGYSPQRLYIIEANPYVAWVKPKETEPKGWSFVSAYPTYGRYLRDLLQRNRGARRLHVVPKVTREPKE